ncbi:MAG: RNase adapter RapZ [Aquabacterium sp.]|jgi:UPF0042 nucleotide-binding protein|nr:MAG: RNase adapter RapZ [Aquabacterium sp.]TAL26189.1 MAG: RNase adapter RapZ [Aquabacterium sp.]
MPDPVLPNLVPSALPDRDVVLVSGTSGSGKSVAMHVLEDIGYFCVDNLPPELLRDLIRLERERGIKRRIAVSIDARTGSGFAGLLPALGQLRADGVHVRSIFLDASSDTLLRRFSESRRPHPLAQDQQLPADDQRVLLETIELERELLGPLREVSTVIDTSPLRPSQLRVWIRNLVEAAPSSLTLVFESFAFKRGVPLDADYVFDVRMLPNPHYVRELRPLTGRDQPVVDYLLQQPDVVEMVKQIESFVARWLPALQHDQRSYVTVAIGCTGGQHRSVYCAEELTRRFTGRATTLVRHRELDAREAWGRA